MESLHNTVDTVKSGGSINADSRLGKHVIRHPLDGSNWNNEAFSSSKEFVFNAHAN